MQFIRDIHSARLGSKRPVISFEFFPPKTVEGDRNLLEKTIPALMKLSPDYCSVTYGAGGSTRDKTLGIVDLIQRKHQLTAMMHLTCVNSTRDQLREVVEEARSKGINNILALRGRFLKELGGFSIGTAGFPEGHIACTEGKLVDWQRLKAKIDCGADFVLTQLFFDNKDFFEFRDHLVKLGVTVPICPGILPILSASQVRKFTTMCGAAMPAPLLEKLENFGENDATTTEFGIEYATSQCAELLREGAPGIHFYTLNKAHSTSRVMSNLGFA